MNIENALRSLNPWWAKESVLDKTLIKREKLIEILETLNLRQIKDILGARRTGKTTILYQIINFLIKNKVDPKKIFFLTFDEINLSTANFEEIEEAIYKINPNPEYIFLDEAQEKKNWERWIKQIYDQKKVKQIFVSGSNASLLTKEIGTLLSGRHITQILYPFSFKEFLLANGWDNFSRENLSLQKNKIQYFLNNYLKNGGFPETIGNEDLAINRILSNVFNDILARDIAVRHNLETEKMDLLAKYLFTNITKEFSYNSLAKAVGINVETVEKYLEYLKEAFLFFTLDVFSYKLKTQFKQNKKIYSLDSGLRNTVAFRFTEDIGKIYENTVFIELKRRNKEIYYWKEKGEIDFIIKEGMNIKEIIQVCKDISDKKTLKRELKSLIDAKKIFKKAKAILITEKTEKEEIIDKIKIQFIPLWKWLLEK